MRKQILEWIIFTSMLIGVCVLAAEPITTAVNAAAIIKNPKDNRLYDSFTLANGMQVIVVSDPDTAISAATLVVGVGSYHNPETQLGLAHYLEHMLFLGTKKHPEVNGFSKFVKENSGYHNAFTNLQNTSYLFAIPNDKYNSALDYFSDYFKEPLFDATYSDKERNAINAEWSSGRANDERIGARILALTGNPHHPFSKFFVGNLETLKDKENSKLHDELVGFYQHYYSANIMKLALVGKQSTAELKELAKKYFEEIPNKNIPNQTVRTPGLLPENYNKAVYYRSHMDVKKLILEFPAENNMRQWNLKPNEYVQSLMHANEAGTLAFYLRENNLADNVSFGWAVNLYGNSGTYTITIDLTKAGWKKQDDVIAATFSYINLIREKGINEIYYNELKFRRNLDYKNEAKQDALATASGLAYDLFDLPVNDILYARYRLDEFNPAAILAVLNQLNLTTVRVGYVSKNESVNTPVPYHDGNYRVEDIAQNTLEKWGGLAKNIQLKLPAENKLLKQVDIEITKNKYDTPKQVVSQPGAQAWLMHSQYYDDKTGLLYLAINTDKGEKNVKNVVLSSLLNDLFTLKNESLLSRYARAGVGAAIELTDQNSQSISISGQTDKHVELMHELVKSFVALEFSEKDVKNVKGRFNSSISNARNADPSAQLSQTLLDFMVKNRWDNDVILDAVTSITVDDLKVYQHEILEQNMLNIFAFGYYDGKMIKDVTSNTLTLMGATRKPGNLFTKQLMIPMAGKIFTSNKVVSHDDNALMDFYISSTQSPEVLADLFVLNAIFNNAIFTQLRTQEQLAYIVGSFVSDFNHHPGFGMSIQSANTDLVKLKARFDNFRISFGDELVKFDEPTVEQVKQSILVQLRQKPINIDAELSVYVNDFINGNYDFKTREKLIVNIESVTKARIIDAYKNLVSSDNSMNIVIQKRGKKFKQTQFSEIKNARIVKSIEDFNTIMVEPDVRPSVDSEKLIAP